MEDIIQITGKMRQDIAILSTVKERNRQLSKLTKEAFAHLVGRFCNHARHETHVYYTRDK
ncbi:Uncharacterised protein [Streptococcus pneumoniae]|nr:Uncharacterised protein [Streptococcus pneumoniae]CIW17762.1 Uncharacterised protein [Streptococcus pneumoniae]CIW30770.1 Uncharacterised protein [Streptococcus pneumoniae]